MWVGWAIAVYYGGWYLFFRVGGYVNGGFMIYCLFHCRNNNERVLHRRERSGTPRYGREGPSTSLEEGLTPADESWRRRGWLVILRARTQPATSATVVSPQWNLTTVARRLSATIKSLRTTRQSPTSNRAVLWQGGAAVSPTASTEASTTGRFSQVVNTVVHLPEEGLFRRILLYL